MAKKKHPLRSFTPELAFLGLHSMLMLVEVDFSPEAIRRLEADYEEARRANRLVTMIE